MRFWPHIAEMVGLFRGSAVPTADPETGRGTIYSRTSGGLYQWTGNAWEVAGGGGGGTPADPVNSLQFNNAGVFGGDANLTWDGYTLTATNRDTSGSFYNAVQGIAYEKGNENGGYAGYFQVVVPIGTPADGGGDIGVEGNVAFLGHAIDPGYPISVVGVEGSISGLSDTGAFPNGYLAGVESTINVPNMIVGGTDYQNGYYFFKGQYANLASSPQGFGAWIPRPNTGTTEFFTAFYSRALGEGSAATITNPYHQWADEQGVYRIRADNTFNSVYQAIPALYNPQFTKYTAGTPNYERIVFQWESNVAVLTTEKGGTGTLRDLRIGDASVNVVIGGNAVQATGGYKSADGSTGATGSANNTNTLTIKNGLVVTIA